MTASAITSPPSAERVHDRTHLDWITVTHADASALRPLLRGPTELRPHGRGMYPKAMRDGHGAVLAWDGPRPRPAMLVLSGKALAAWRSEWTDHDLVARLASVQAHCTRLDLARTTSGLWTPYRLRDYVEADRYVSKWHGFTYRCAKGTTALTVYAGSRSSEVFLRVYDKRAEMEASGEACPFPRLSRWEFETKGARAVKALRTLAALPLNVDPATGEETWSLRSVHSAWLSHRLTLTLRPVDRDNHNQTRAAADPSWTAFVESDVDANLSPELDARSPERVAYDLGRWARGHLAPAAALIVDLAGPEVLERLVRAGSARMTAKHRMLLGSAAATRSALVAGLQGRGV